MHHRVMFARSMPRLIASSTGRQFLLARSARKSGLGFLIRLLVAQLATPRKHFLASFMSLPNANIRKMEESAKTAAKKQPRRPHYIKEWAQTLGLSQTELAEAIEADKSQVTRWYKGASPSEDYQNRLASLFDCPVESIFRHPDEAWLTEFIAGRDQDEINRIKAMLEAGFPRKTSS